MKNIHILPIDKPSRLHYSKVKSDDEISYKLVLNKELSICNDGLSSGQRHIYTTSDEEIKTKEYILIIREGLLIGKLGEVVLIESTREGRTDYIRMDGIRGWFASNVNYQKDWNYRKIILTTDQDLIKDGVQAIDDEFLNWFVKNPSCEFVDIKKVANGVANHKLTYEYKIIIPKEEPKQETLEEAAEKSNGYNLYAKDTKGQAFTEGFIMGAKWMQERMYSEEDVINALHSVELKDNKDYSNIYIGIKEWFEQFKKK